MPIQAAPIATSQEIKIGRLDQRACKPLIQNHVSKIGDVETAGYVSRRFSVSIFCLGGQAIQLKLRLESPSKHVQIVIVEIVECL